MEENVKGGKRLLKGCGRVLGLGSGPGFWVVVAGGGWGGCGVGGSFWTHGLLNLSILQQTRGCQRGPFLQPLRMLAGIGAAPSPTHPQSPVL